MKGKHALQNRWTKNIFTDKTEATTVSHFGFKIFEKDEKLYGIQIWDLASKDEEYC